MNNIKVQWKNILGVLIVATIVGVLGYFKYTGYQQLDTVNTETATVSSVASRILPTAVTASSVKIESAPKPENGKPRGVIEVGASGFNAFVINADKEGRYEVTSKQFGDSLAYEGMTSTDEVKSGLKKYLGQMLNKGVNPKDLHFVISSGALKEPKMKTIAEGIRQAGFVVTEVTPEQEGHWALIAAMHPTYKDRAYVVDIGSGNTKISWYEGGRKETIEASGAKYFQIGLSDNDVLNELREKANKVPASKREYCFLIGGAPYSLYKKTPNNEGRYTVLNPFDTYQAGDDKRIASGLTILKGIQAGTGTKNFIFDVDANFSIGFLISLNK